jgi:hypothetical protein
MARPNLELVRALRVTASRLAHGAAYQWSNFACCNCGHLVQSVTQLSPREIYEAAFLRGGDWGQQAREFCQSSGYPIDFVLARLFELGLSPEDVHNLERLSDDRVLRELAVFCSRADPRASTSRLLADPRASIELSYTRREDVVLYLEAWARWLERQLGSSEQACEFEQNLAAAE